MPTEGQRLLRDFIDRPRAPGLRLVAGGPVRQAAPAESDAAEAEAADAGEGGLIMSALRIAFAEADEARETILRRLRARDVIALGLAMASAVSSGSVIIFLGLPDGGAQMARWAALAAIVTAIGPVMVDHLSLKPKEGWGLIDRIGAIKGRVRTLEFRMPSGPVPEGIRTKLLDEAVALIEELTDMEARLETLGLRG